jgi:L-seryl-tRNA(Ser) seleniumtransferase
MRAFRLDKMTLAALEATLRLYLDAERALHEVPLLRLLNTPLAHWQQRAQTLAESLRTIDGLTGVRVIEDIAYVGGGSLPDQAAPTWVVEIQAAHISDAELAGRLRLGEPPIISRVHDGKVVLDVRTILEPQQGLLADAIRRALRLAPGSVGDVMSAR